MKRNEASGLFTKPSLFARDGLYLPCRFAECRFFSLPRRDDGADAPAEGLRGGAIFENPAGGHLQVHLAHRQARGIDDKENRAEGGGGGEVGTGPPHRE